MRKMQNLRRRSRAPRQAAIETLENRQLLSAVIDLRLPDGRKTATVTSVGQTVNIDVWAVVTGKDATGSNDGIQDLSASFVSTGSTSTSVKGNLAAANLAPFDGSGATTGAETDLNGDGAFDIGSSATDSSIGYFFARSGSMTTTGGTVSGASQSFKVGTLTYTVTSNAAGDETDINVVPRSSPFGAIWCEDGKNTAPILGGVLSTGTPIRLNAGVSPSPSASISGNIVKDLNGNGLKEGGEPGLAGVTVFIDANKNGIKDASEKSVLTGASGSYTFTGLAAGTYRIRESVPSNEKLVSPTAGYFDVAVTSSSKVTGKNFFDQPKAAVVVTVDNPQATKTGTWTSLASPSGFVGTNYLSDGNTGKGSKSVTYKAALPSGTYLVYARWVSGSNRASSVPIDVHSTTGTNTVKVNQQINGGQWVLLGTYSFSATTGATIVVRNANTSGLVIADAVQLVKVV
jgi:hypothetical protein